ncbi:type II toxin-antitoxin system mRNA interferase toxin, RelE/StbE family [Bdellovibrio sp. HCB288]|uniref:type II toxin-antitoxin system mRNA interferase toxin, RelE/StbE family n=1 Tax=Bdellovibrio sp. HCB288 TaxID=3394355 RepID=UPI0039B4578A
MSPFTVVLISRQAEKQIRKLPHNIREALRYWVETVQLIGIRETRKLSGYHDEPLKGNRLGQRSVRLNHAYRVIYIPSKGDIEITVIEVNKHAY